MKKLCEKINSTPKNCFVFACKIKKKSNVNAGRAVELIRQFNKNHKGKDIDYIVDHEYIYLTTKDSGKIITYKYNLEGKILSKRKTVVKICKKCGNEAETGFTCNACRKEYTRKMTRESHKRKRESKNLRQNSFDSELLLTTLIDAAIRKLSKEKKITKKDFLKTATEKEVFTVLGNDEVERIKKLINK